MKKQKTAIIISFFVALLIMCPWGNANAQSTATIKIGTQTWTTKNLDVSTYRNGDAIPQVQDATRWSKLKTGAWYYNENKTENGTTYGKLYNWYAVNDPRDLAPEGWHIPSNTEWTTIGTYLGDAFPGAAMKDTGIILWATPNQGANNSSGFTGLPGGYRNASGEFGSVGKNGKWWSSTDYNTEGGISRQLNYYNGEFSREDDYKRSGFSIRCLKD